MPQVDVGAHAPSDIQRTIARIKIGCAPTLFSILVDHKGKAAGRRRCACVLHAHVLYRETSRDPPECAHQDRMRACEASRRSFPDYKNQAKESVAVMMTTSTISKNMDTPRSAALTRRLRPYVWFAIKGMRRRNQRLSMSA